MPRIAWVRGKNITTHKNVGHIMSYIFWMVLKKSVQCLVGGGIKILVRKLLHRRGGFLFDWCSLRGMVIGMADIQFQEPQYTRSASYEKGPVGISGLVIRFGLAKDEAAAQKVLLIVLGVCVIAIFAFLFMGSAPSSSVPLPPTP